MSDADDYIRVTGKLRDIRDASFLLEVGDGVARGAWIPRSLIHGADDIALKAKKKGDAMAVRIFRWKAEEVGFVTERDNETRDLF